MEKHFIFFVYPKYFPFFSQFFIVFFSVRSSSFPNIFFSLHFLTKPLALGSDYFPINSILRSIQCKHSGAVWTHKMMHLSLFLPSVPSSLPRPHSMVCSFSFLHFFPFRFSVFCFLPPWILPFNWTKAREVMISDFNPPKKMRCFFFQFAHSTTIYVHWRVRSNAANEKRTSFSYSLLNHFFAFSSLFAFFILCAAGAARHEQNRTEKCLCDFDGKLIFGVNV